MKEQNLEKEKSWNNGADQFQLNYNSKQAKCLEVSLKQPKTIDEIFLGVKAW
jgi:hypothetical protein